MANPKNDTPRIDAITPAGIAKYPRLNTPDDKFSPGDPKFDVQLVFDPSEDGTVGKKPGNIIDAATTLRDEFVEATRTRLIEASNEAKAAKNGAKAKALSDKAKTLKIADIGKADVDDEGEETGKVILRAKMKQLSKRKDGSVVKREPTMFDARGKKLVNRPQVGGGSTLKVAITMMPYHMESTNEVGVTFYLNAVQILDLVSGGERTAEAYGFGEEDGYESQDETFAGSASAPAAGEDEDF